MGYVTRRIVGHVVFLSALGLLSSAVVSANDSSGGALLAGTGGAVAGIAVLFLALMASWTVRWTMRRRARLRRRFRPW